MITFAAAYWGDWPNGWNGERYRNLGVEYCLRQQAALARHCPVDHRYVVFTDDLSRMPESIDARPHPGLVRGHFGARVPTKERSMSKAWIYGAPFSGCDLQGRVIVLDLDDLIIGDLGDMVSVNAPFVCGENFQAARKTQWRVGGDMVSVRVGSPECKAIAEAYALERATNCAHTGADERKLIELSGIVPEYWGRILPGQRVSLGQVYKHGLPHGARVVSCHGRRKPHHLVLEGVSWAVEAWGDWP